MKCCAALTSRGVRRPCRRARQAPCDSDRRRHRRAAICEHLARRGWHIDLIESRALPDAQAPAKYAGVFHPHISRDDCILSRTARNGYLYAIERWLALERSGLELTWSRCGVRNLAGDAEQEQRMIAAVAAMDFPAGFLRQYLARGEAELHAGCELVSGGWWYPGAGWMRPLSLIAAQIAAAGPACRRISAPGEHRLRGRVLAGAGRSGQTHRRRAGAGAREFERCGASRSRRAASAADARTGQLSARCGHARSRARFSPVRLCAARVGRRDRDRQHLRARQQRSRAAGPKSCRKSATPRANAAAGARAGRCGATRWRGGLSLRCTGPPALVGALPDVDAARAHKKALSGADLADLPRRNGLYCATAYASRGLVWAALAGELLASLIEGEPLPLEGDLADALDPGRFVMKQARRGKI